MGELGIVTCFPPGILFSRTGLVLHRAVGLKHCERSPMTLNDSVVPFITATIGSGLKGGRKFDAHPG